MNLARKENYSECDVRHIDEVPDAIPKELQNMWRNEFTPPDGNYTLSSWIATAMSQSVEILYVLAAWIAHTSGYDEHRPHLSQIDYWIRKAAKLSKVKIPESCYKCDQRTRPVPCFECETLRLLANQREAG